MKRWLSVLVFLVLVTACPPKIPDNTGIEGQVFIGPMCPVVQQGQECPDRPYQATLTVLTASGHKVTQFTTDAEGRFQVPLAPGDYILRPQTPANQPMPVAAEQAFTVTEGQFTQVDVTYDSGIR